VRNSPADVCPQQLPVRLKDGPLRPLVYGMLQIGKVAAQVDILPLGIRTDGARAPKPQAPVFKESEAIDAQRIEYVLLRLVKNLFKIDGQRDHFIGRGLVDSAQNVIARVNAGDEP